MTIVADRVRETTTTTGTGAVTLAGAQPGFRTFLTALGAGSTDVYYCIADTTPNNWEVGLGTYVSSTNTLSRTSVYASSNANALVSFGSGTKDVYITVPTTLLNTYATKTGTETFDNKTLSSLNTGPLAGFRNKIINGKMDVAQRGTSFTSTGYCLDRWTTTNSSSAVYTITQATDGPNNNIPNCLKLTINTADTAIAAGDRLIIQQPIEGYNSRDLIGNTFTLSFWVRSSKTGTHCASFQNSGLTSSYIVAYTVNTANTWEYKTITVTGGLTSGGTWSLNTGVGLYVNFALVCGSTYQGSAGSWLSTNSLGTSAQVNVADTVNNTFSITGVQLELGTSATPSENRLYSVELDLCYRYYWQLGPVSSSAQQGLMGVWVSTTTLDFYFSIPATMRIPPASVTTSAWSWSTSTFTGQQVGAFSYNSGAFLTSSHTSIGLSSAGNAVSNILLRFTGSGGAFSGAAGNVLQIVTGPSVWFGFSAEL